MPVQSHINQSHLSSLQRITAPNATHSLQQSTTNTQQSTIEAGLWDLAGLTPYLGGDAVYSARVMLGIDPRDYNLFHRYAKPNRTALPVVNTLKVYPNPVSDELTIEILDGMEDGVVTVELFDLPGKKMFSGQITISSSKGSVNLGGVKNGIYLLKISDAYGNRKTARIVVNK